MPARRDRGLPEVSALAVLRQDVRARSLEVQHAAVEGAIMRVSKRDAGGGSRKAVRAAQAGHDGRHLVLGANTRSHAHTRDAGLPWFGMHPNFCSYGY